MLIDIHETLTFRLSYAAFQDLYDNVIHFILFAFCFKNVDELGNKLIRRKIVFQEGYPIQGPLEILMRDAWSQFFHQVWIMVDGPSKIKDVPYGKTGSAISDLFGDDFRRGLHIDLRPFEIVNKKGVFCDVACKDEIDFPLLSYQLQIIARELPII